ncbi:Holliday junction resolvase RuvX [Aestuariivirga litoralis]|uniref:Holliday junction resolvase RuvX n=1 Tax=Aestuariivirga litoralis TaxID=2650924 RepID=UPI0018C7D02A|nr:Holliday junction resolvase RuvX [Aestuariivirga litoralis]MBG1231602.1 Holliday junction resolvase RuvX [Aestuariivirga litoralis]
MIPFLEIARSSIEALPPGQRIVALDLGSKTIGIATSDLTLSIATPRHTMARGKFQADAKLLLEFAAAEGIGLIVLGMPLNMDGSEGPRAQSTRAFVRNLEKLTPIPIIYWDERLSTAAVERTMLEADLSRAKRAENVDKLAASYILQGLLDLR